MLEQEMITADGELKFQQRPQDLASTTGYLASKTTKYTVEQIRLPRAIPLQYSTDSFAPKHFGILQSLLSRNEFRTRPSSMCSQRMTSVYSYSAKI